MIRKSTTSILHEKGDEVFLKIDQLETTILIFNLASIAMILQHYRDVILETKDPVLQWDLLRQRFLEVSGEVWPRVSHCGTGACMFNLFWVHLHSKILLWWDKVLYNFVSLWHF